MVSVNKEFLSHLEEIQKNNKEVISAIMVLNRFPDTDLKIVLNINYSENEYNNFLKVSDVKYENGFGLQELYGYIWYNDGTWSERHEYDGEEEWRYKKCPSFQDTLNFITKIKEEQND